MVDYSRIRYLISELQLMQQNVDKLEGDNNKEKRLEKLKDMKEKLNYCNEVLLDQMFQLDKELKLVEEFNGNIWVLKSRVTEEIDRIKTIIDGK